MIHFYEQFLRRQFERYKKKDTNESFTKSNRRHEEKKRGRNKIMKKGRKASKEVWFRRVNGRKSTSLCKFSIIKIPLKIFLNPLNT